MKKSAKYYPILLLLLIQFLLNASSLVSGTGKSEDRIQNSEFRIQNFGDMFDSNDEYRTTSIEQRLTNNDQTHPLIPSQEGKSSIEHRTTINEEQRDNPLNPPFLRGKLNADNPLNPPLLRGKAGIIREDDVELKKKREEWVKEMHRCERGVNYEILDKETRISKLEIRKGRIQNSEFRIQNLKKKGAKNLRIEDEEQDTVKIKSIGGVWSEKGSRNQAGRIMTADIDFDRNLIYAISQGGNVWRGSLNGTDWTCLNNSDNFGGSLIRILKFGDSVRILVVSNQSVYYSDDDGMTWESAAGFQVLKQWGGLRRGVVQNNSTNTIYVFGTEWDWEKWKAITVIYRSTDRGESFTKFKNYDTRTELVDICAPRYNSTDVYLMHKDSLFRIDETGKMSEPMLFNASLPTDNFDALSGIMLMGATINNETTLAVVLRSAEAPTEHFYATADNVSYWVQTGTLNFGPFTNNSFELSAINPQIIYYGGVEFYTSHDYGINWALTNGWGEYYGDPENKLHADIPGINSFLNKDGNEMVLISTDGGLYVSNDNCVTVKNLTLEGMNVSQYYSVYTNRKNPNIIFAGSQDQGFQRCRTDSGGIQEFEQTISGDYGHLTSSDSGNTIWSVYPGFAMLYKNAPANIEGYFWDFSQHQNWQWMPQIQAFPGEPGTALIAGGDTNSGSHLWLLNCNATQIGATQLPFDFSEKYDGSVLTSFAVSEINYDYIYALTNDGKFYHTADAGETWIESDGFKGPDGHYFYGAKLLPSKNELGRLYIAGSGYSTNSCYFSYDDGRSFTPCDSGLPKTLIYDLAISDDEKFLFASTEVGPYLYIVEDNCWYDIMSADSPDQLYWSVEYIPSLRTARFATYGRGIWDFKMIDIISTEVTENSNVIPPKLVIEANPNPVNDKTEITFNMPRDMSGSIKIYDLTGRIVKEFFSGKIPAGFNKYIWDGRSDAGFSLPEGNYIFVVSAGGMSNYVKLILER